MSQPSKKREAVAKDGWVKTGARSATTSAREGIMVHMGEPPSSLWFTTPSRIGSSPSFFCSAGPPDYWLSVQINLRQFRQRTSSRPRYTPAAFSDLGFAYRHH